MLVTSSGKRHVTVYHPSIYPVSIGLLTVTHQEAACDADIVHIGPIIRTDILG